MPQQNPVPGTIKLLTKETFRRFFSFSSLYHIYGLFVSIVGIILFIWANLQPCHCSPHLFLFIALIVLAELTTSEGLSSQLAFSSSAAVSFATLLLFGPAAAALVAMTGGISTTLIKYYSQQKQEQPTKQSRASLSKRLLFNMSTYGWSVFTAGHVYVLVGGQIGDFASFTNLLPLIIAAIVNEIVNAATVVGIIALQIRQSPWGIWKQSISWAQPINLGSMVVGGAGLALGYQIAGLLGIAVFFLPNLLSIYAFRFYIRQTKIQMDHLETIIDDRTQELREANQTLKKLDEERLAFFSMINHELRSPLNGILGYTQLMQQDSALSTQHQTMVGIMHHSGEHLLSLINDILDLSKLEVDKTDIQETVFNLDPFLKSLVNICRLEADQKGLDFHCNFAPEILTNIRGSEQHLRQVLINLINNGIKYTQHGSINFSAYRVGHKIRFQIDDTGIGIRPEDLNRIFMPFRRAQGRHKSTQGTGLGLAISKRLVDAMGGDLAVKSTLNQGSSFWFDLELPVVTDNDHAGDQTDMDKAQAILIIPPLKIVKNLHELALKGDIQQIKQVTSELQETDDTYSAFVGRLNELAARYRMKQIRQFLVPYLEKEPMH